ncbi:P-loop containing nucleoside triphosphate hydrolase protein [Rickenella mellea]|uniref:P-loop containing nucleoside triphosphate hydrolase protein n=1 Tax=Rickenella mellea TaxID=50990 RepID=A0A4Y7QD16_9AGAM|nr:P-loop containing nucleoside triphosphate hydrolase protein [Rickenella mellea]
MRLRTILSTTPKPVIDALSECGINTPTDFLFGANLETMFQRMSPGTASYEELLEARQRLINALAADVVTGDQMLASQQGVQASLSHWLTGIRELDEILESMPFGVMELSGAKGAGKTALALHIAASCLAHDSNTVVHWIDTSGDFSAERAANQARIFQQERKLVASPGSPVALPSSLRAVLDRLQVSLAFDVEAAHDILESLRLTLNSEERPHARVLVIDAITPLLGPHLNAVSAQGHAIMTTFMRHLRAFAQTYHTLIVVTNNATASQTSNPASAFASTTLKPALGPSFAFLTDATLWLARASDVLSPSSNTGNRSAHPPATNDDENVHIAEVFRSRSSISRKWWTFQIAEGLIRIQL